MNVFGDEEDHLLLRPNIIRVGKAQFIDFGCYQRPEEENNSYNDPHPDYIDNYDDEPNW